MKTALLSGNISPQTLIASPVCFESANLSLYSTNHVLQVAHDSSIAVGGAVGAGIGSPRKFFWSRQKTPSREEQMEASEFTLNVSSLNVPDNADSSGSPVRGDNVYSFAEGRVPPSPTHAVVPSLALLTSVAFPHSGIDIADEEEEEDEDDEWSDNDDEEISIVEHTFFDAVSTDAEIVMNPGSYSHYRSDAGVSSTFHEGHRTNDENIDEGDLCDAPGDATYTPRDGTSRPALNGDICHDPVRTASPSSGLVLTPINEGGSRGKTSGGKRGKKGGRGNWNRTAGGQWKIIDEKFGKVVVKDDSAYTALMLPGRWKRNENNELEWVKISDGEFVVREKDEESTSVASDTGNCGRRGNDLVWVQMTDSDFLVKEKEKENDLRVIHTDSTDSNSTSKEIQKTQDLDSGSPDSFRSI